MKLSTDYIKVAWLRSIGIGSVVVFTSIMEPHPPNDDEDNLPEADDFDPTEVFTMEDFLAEDEIVEEFMRKIGDGLKADIEGRTSCVTRRRRQSGPRRYIPRNREAGHDDLVANYFSTNPIYTDEMFRRRFRMNKPLFLRIVQTLSNWDPYFTQRVDATDRDGHSLLERSLFGFGN